jgi:hypothetical protein
MRLLISHQMSTDDTDFFDKSKPVHRIYGRNHMGLLTKGQAICITVHNDTRRADRKN